MNERLPVLSEHQPTMFPTPSMRLQHRTPSTDSVQAAEVGANGSLNMDYLIRRTLEDEGVDQDDDEFMEKLAERIARSRRNGVLRRYETAP